MKTFLVYFVFAAFVGQLGGCAFYAPIEQVPPLVSAQRNIVVLDDGAVPVVSKMRSGGELLAMVVASSVVAGKAAMLTKQPFAAVPLPSGAAAVSKDGAVFFEDAMAVNIADLYKVDAEIFLPHTFQKTLPGTTDGFVLTPTAGITVLLNEDVVLTCAIVVDAQSNNNRVWRYTYLDQNAAQIKLGATKYLSSVYFKEEIRSCFKRLSMLFVEHVSGSLDIKAFKPGAAYLKDGLIGFKAVYIKDDINQQYIGNSFNMFRIVPFRAVDKFEFN